MREIEFPEASLARGEDVDAARAVEAGVYAERLLARGVRRRGLAEVAEAGTCAAHRLFWTGVRIAARQVSRLSQAAGLPADELFQDACVSVAEAVYRFDHRRGVRFTTYVYTAVTHSLATAARHRVGAAPRREDRRAARLALGEQERRGADGVEVGLASAAAAVGVDPSAAQRGAARLVPLDDVTTADPGAEEDFARVLAPGLDFLALLDPLHRRVLGLRFGIDGPGLTLSETAAALRVSTSTVVRWERAALDEARVILSGDRITAADRLRPAPPPAVPCGASPAR